MNQSTNILDFSTAEKVTLGVYDFRSRPIPLDDFTLGYRVWVEGLPIEAKGAVLEELFYQVKRQVLDYLQKTNT